MPLRFKLFIRGLLSLTARLFIKVVVIAVIGVGCLIYGIVYENILVLLIGGVLLIIMLCMKKMPDYDGPE